MYKILSMVMTIALIGCTPLRTQPDSSAQCVGVMTSEDAYGYMNPNHFTVQVLALKQEKDIKEYIRNIDPKHPVWVNWKTSRGTQWYAVTAGDFASKDEARAAISSLPHGVRQASPFVISFAEMKQKQQTNVVRMR